MIQRFAPADGTLKHREGDEVPLDRIASSGGMSGFSIMAAGTPWRVSSPLFLIAMGLGAGLMALGFKRIAG